ncbi:MAG: hypothetical protein AAGC72_14920 [Planctomycetota bacterium]
MRRTRMRFVLPLGAGLLLLFVLPMTTGCRYRPDPGRTDRVSSNAYPEVTVQSELRTRIVVAPPTVRNDPGTPMSVTVPVRYIPLRRLDGDACPAQYRILFLEADGTPINPDPVWKYVDLPARTQVFLTGAALDLGAVAWRCEIRPNDVEDVTPLRPFD